MTRRESNYLVLALLTATYALLLALVLTRAGADNIGSLLTFY